MAQVCVCVWGGLGCVKGGGGVLGCVGWIRGGGGSWGCRGVCVMSLLMKMCQCA